jgi:hypothetical protein
MITLDKEYRLTAPGQIGFLQRIPDDFPRHAPVLRKPAASQGSSITDP